MRAGHHPNRGEASIGTDWVRRSEGRIERIEACFAGRAFSPHRHDHYAIGITIEGVQCFDYRGAARNSLPGQIVILHPDELHDGRAGDDRAFRYRTAYLAPADIQRVLGGPLPFIEGGICDDPRLRAATNALLRDLEHPLDALESECLLLELAIALAAAAGTPPRVQIANRGAAARARELIEARLATGVTLTELERVTGHDRWQLSRDFRALYGTSPYRYLMMRRIDAALARVRAGESLAEAALDCGFADQSHFTRSLKRATGLTPNAWRALDASARSFKTGAALPG